MKPINPTVADPSGTGAKYKAFLLSDDEAQESDEYILGAGEEVDEDPQVVAVPHQSPPPQTDKPQSLIQILKHLKLTPLITEDYWEKHEEAAMHYANLKASIDEYYDENVAYRDQTDKQVETSMSALDRSSTTIKDLYKGLNIITELLKEINNVVKDDPATNKKIHEATETFVKMFINITEVLYLVKGFNFSDLHFTVKDLQAHVVKQEAELADWTKSSTNMLALGFQVLRELTTTSNLTCPLFRKTCSLPPSHTEGETEDKESEDPKMAVLISFIKPTKVQPITIINAKPSVTLRKGKGIATDEQAKKRKLVKASSIVRPDPDAPILIPYTINGKLFHLTFVERLKRWIDPTKISSAKEGEKFKKDQDDELMTLNNEKIEKAIKSLELRKHEYENYIWTISSRLKFEKITDVKVHLKTKPVVITVYRGTNGRNFKVHNPFSFGAFAITELDELREIIPKKKNIVSALPAPVSEQASSQTLGRKRKHMELETEVKVSRLECNRSLPEGVLFVNNMVIKEPEYGIFFTDVFSDQAFQRWNDIHKVKVDSLVSYLVMASNIKTQ
ncbi:hypothetical protein Tco_1243621 [Tanacetum coccineum]